MDWLNNSNEQQNDMSLLLSKQIEVLIGKAVNTYKRVYKLESGKEFFVRAIHAKRVSETASHVAHLWAFLSNRLLGDTESAEQDENDMPQRKGNIISYISFQ